MPESSKNYSMCRQIQVQKINYQQIRPRRWKFIIFFFLFFLFCLDLVDARRQTMKYPDKYNLIACNNYIKLLMHSLHSIQGEERKEAGHQISYFKGQKLKGIINPKIKKTQIRQVRSLNLSHNQYYSLSKGGSDLPEINRRQSDTIDVQRDHEIYFNRNKKYNYMKNIIDKYFQQTKGEKFYLRNNHEIDEIHKNYINKSIASIDYSNIDNSRRNGQEKRINPRKLAELRRKNKPKIIKEEQQEDDLNSTLSQSRLLQSKNQSAQQSQVGKMFSISKSNLHQLPTINEIFEDKQQNFPLIRYQSISYINQSQAQQVKQNRIRLLENQIYFIQLVLKNNKPSHKIKTYKEKGQALLIRQLRAHSMGVQPVWIQYKYDPRSLISNLNPSLKQLLYKAKKIDIDSKFFTLKQKSYYKKLIHNKCQELKRVLIQFCYFMKKNEVKLVNNKINTGNIYLSKNENFRLGQWGFSSFRQTHIIQNMEFQNRIQPIIKSQKQWFIPPQYVAPEIIKAIVFEQQTDPMNLGSAPDRWALGVTLFQILTLIPVWISQKCVIHGKSMVARSGILAVPERDLKKILKRQEKLPSLMKKIFEEQFSEEGFDSTLLQIVTKCVQLRPQNRISYDQIIDKLKCLQAI